MPVWNKTSGDHLRAQPQPPAPASPQTWETEAPRQRASGVIGPSVKIKGDITSGEELYIDGQVEGTLSIQHGLTVGANGKVLANIKARDLTILGSVRGNVEVSGKLAIREKGSLIGDVRTAGISIDDGAFFKGGIDIVRPEPANDPAKAASPQSA